MELRQLKYFISVADCRSFVKAANALYISRQAISKAISQLEEELQVELFMRDSRGAFLTPAGILFYERARNSILELEQLQEDIRQYGTQYQQTIRVAFSVGTLALYEERLQVFLQKQSAITVQYFECTPGECESLLLEHKADLVVTSTTPENQAFQCQTIHTSPYGVLVRRQESLQAVDALSPFELRWLPLGCLADGQGAKLCLSLDISPAFQGLDLFRLLTICARGQCAILLPRCLAPEILPDLQWIPLEVEEPWQVYSAYLTSAENNTLFHSALDTFLMQVLDQENI